MAEERTEYWFNLKTKQVEVGKQSAALFRVGPFATFAEAQRAEQTLADRAKAWREEEDRDNDRN